MTAPTESHAGRVPRRRRVLVVDDDPDAADLLKVILEKLGFEAFAERDGEKAVAKAHDWRADVVLCELGLRGLDGYQVASRLRADATLTGLRLVALATKTDDETRRRSRASGYDANLLKGADLAELLAAIDPFRVD
jgi:DNA-binding response OmpR family regulator